MDFLPLYKLPSEDQPISVNTTRALAEIDAQEKRLPKRTQGTRQRDKERPKIKFDQEMPSCLMGKGNPHIYIALL